MPEPKQKAGESRIHYRGRLIKHYVREGKPRNQAIAIAHQRTR